MTPEDFNIKLYRLVMIENIATMLAIVAIIWALGWPYGLFGFILLMNLTFVKETRSRKVK